MSKHWLVLTAVVLGAALAAACSDGETGENAAGGGHSHDVVVAEAWARETAGNPGENSALYARITNGQHESDRLVAASVPASIAARAEFHTTMQDGDTLRMVPVEGWDLDADGGQIILEPGSDHVMLLDLPHRLEAGQAFPVTLTFERAGEVEASVEVRSTSGESASEADADHDHDDDDDDQHDDDADDAGNDG